jgi:hypothetical protein
MPIFGKNIPGRFLKKQLRFLFAKIRPFPWPVKNVQGEYELNE